MVAFTSGVQALIFACPSWCGVTVIVWLELLMLTVATEVSSELTLTVAPGGDQRQLEFPPDDN
jgi:hypothetical protein